MKYIIIAGVLAAGMLTSCGSDHKDPGTSYMPDMTYSRAYETYASTEDLTKEGINYTRKPVAGTVARGDDFPFTLKHDSTGYAQAAALKNPFDTLAGKLDLKEAERLYLINCGICHGAELNGNGPLFKGGEGPFTAAPKDFTSAEMKAMTAGTMFYSVTYGKGQMGSYASQLSTKQRWEIIGYIKSKQGGDAPAADSAAVVKK